MTNSNRWSAFSSARVWSSARTSTCSRGTDRKERAVADPNTCHSFTSSGLEMCDAAENVARLNHGRKVHALARALTRLVRYHEDDEWREDEEDRAHGYTDGDVSFLRALLTEAGDAIND